MKYNWFINLSTRKTLVIQGIKGARAKGHVYKLNGNSKDMDLPNTLKNKQTCPPTSGSGEATNTNLGKKDVTC